MSVLRNNIPIQRKGMGDSISNQEWNSFINQLANQTNNNSSLINNVIEEAFIFNWEDLTEEVTVGDYTEIIRIPDNSLDTEVITQEDFKNYFNNNEQYPAVNWKYCIVEYKRGTRVFKLISKGIFFLDLNEISNFIELLDKKVDKVKGKQLSTNDFTDLLKTKLDGIEEGAEKNIDSDWFSQEGEKGFIKNKPTHMLASDVFPWAKKQYMDARDIPGLDTSKITEGVFDPLRIPNLPMSKTIGLETELTRLENDKVSVATFNNSLNTKLGSYTPLTVILQHGTNLGDVTTSGFYRLSSGVDDGPSEGGSNSYGQMIVSKGADTISQIFMSYSTNKMWFRSATTSTPGNIIKGKRWETVMRSQDLADWAKAASKPTYTAAEVGARPADDVPWGEVSGKPENIIRQVSFSASTGTMVIEVI